MFNFNFEFVINKLSVEEFPSLNKYSLRVLCHKVIVLNITEKHYPSSSIHSNRIRLMITFYVENRREKTIGKEFDLKKGGGLLFP